MPFLNTNIPELSGFDTGLCLSNLDLLMTRQNHIIESMLGVLSELCDAILQDAENDPDTVDSILLSLQGLPEGETKDIPLSVSSVSPINQSAVERLSGHAGLQARLLLYAMIENRMPTASAPKITSPLPPSTRGRIAYMPAAFADKAYLALSAAVSHPRSVPTPGFVDACEEVRSGLCEFCILPLESSHGGKMTAFTRLLLRYNLQITAICDLENGAAEGQITRFALLSAGREGIFPSTLCPPQNGEPLYLELIHTGESPSLTDLLAAAEFCGLKLCRVDTLPRFEELDFERPLISCVLDVAEGDLPTFRRFLSLEAPENTVIGLYGAV